MDHPKWKEQVNKQKALEAEKMGELFITGGVISELQSGCSGTPGSSVVEVSVNKVGQLEASQNEVEPKQDIFNIYSDGEPADPISLTDPGFIDIARIEAGGSFGALALLDGL